MNIKLKNTILISIISLLLIIVLSLAGVYLLTQQKEETNTNDSSANANTATDKKEEDLPKVAPDPDAEPVKAPKGSLLEGKVLAPPPSN